MRINVRFILLSISVALLNGCSSLLGYKSELDQYQEQLTYNHCDYTLINHQIESDPVLWSLNGGALARTCRDYVLSNHYLDSAEAYIKQQETSPITANVNHSLISILINNNVNNYYSDNYEKIMMNLYKGLNFLSLNDFDNARVEFNRVLDRQRRAAEYFEKEIEQAYDQFYRSKYVTNIALPIKPDSKINNYQGDISPEIVYPDFINPFATYLSGLFFYLDQDDKKALDLFKQTARMLPNQAQIKKDINLIQQNRKKRNHYVWLIYENGQGMIKKAFTYHFPSYLFTRKIVTSEISLPTIYKRSESYPYLILNNQQTTLVTNMDNIVQQEFNKKRPIIMSEAMLNMVAKSTLQYVLEEHFEDYGGTWIGFFYQLLTDHADIRQWRAIPKNFQVARVTLTDDPIVLYKPNGSVLTTIHSLLTNQDAIIYIKSDIVEHYTVHIIQKGRKN